MAKYVKRKKLTDIVATRKAEKYVKFGIVTHPNEILVIGDENSLFTIPVIGDAKQSIIDFLKKNSNIKLEDILEIETISNFKNSCGTCSSEYSIAIVVVDNKVSDLMMSTKYSAFTSGEIWDMSTKNIINGEKFTDADTILFVLFISSVLGSVY